MALARKLLTHRIVYWAPGEPDEYGKKGFLPPIEVAGRWEEGVTDMGVGTPDPRTPGADVSIRTVVYTEVEVETGGVIWKGTFDRITSLTNPFAHPGAAEVSEVHPVDDIKTRETLWEIVL